MLRIDASAFADRIHDGTPILDRCFLTEEYNRRERRRESRQLQRRRRYRAANGEDGGMDYRPCILGNGAEGGYPDTASARRRHRPAFSTNKAQIGDAGGDCSSEFLMFGIPPFLTNSRSRRIPLFRLDGEGA